MGPVWWVILVGPFWWVLVGRSWLVGPGWWVLVRGPTGGSFLVGHFGGSFLEGPGWWVLVSVIEKFKMLGILRKNVIFLFDIVLCIVFSTDKIHTDRMYNFIFIHHVKNHYFTSIKVT